MQDQPESPQKEPLQEQKRQKEKIARGDNGRPRDAFRAWPEILARVRGAKHRVLLLDLDGTLVRLRRRPEDVHLPAASRQVLEQLALFRHFLVFIVSGRPWHDLKRLVAARGVRYVGLHGGEWEGKSVVLNAETRQVLERLKNEARARLRYFSGVWIEDKNLSFAVHYRGVRTSTANAVEEIVRDLAGRGGNFVYVMPGDKVWEILPRQIRGKGAVVRELVRKQLARSAVIYAGDDASDETAFAVLPGQITIKIGRLGHTRARFRLDGPGELLRFLSRLERELR